MKLLPRTLIALAFVAAHPVHAAVPLEGGGANSPVPGIINYQGRVTVGGVSFTGSGQFKFALVDGGVNQSQTATAFASTDGSTITNISLLYFGSGYTTPPTVTISAPDGPGGEQATAVAVLASLGTNLARIDITNHGSGYTNSIALTVTIAPPPANIVATTYWSNDGTSLDGSEPTAAIPLGVNAGLYAVPLGDTSLPNMLIIPASVFENPDVRLRVWFNDGVHGSQLLTPDQRIAAVGYAMMAGDVPDGSITSTKLANGAVSTAQIANGAIAPTNLTTNAAPQAGQVLSYDAANSTFDWVAGGAVVFPFNDSFNSPVSVLGLTNYSGDAIYAATAAIGKSAVFGRNDVYSTNPGQIPGQGVYGYGKYIATGVLGVSELGDGIVGRTNQAGKSGVFGYTEKIATAVLGISEGGTGVAARTNAANQSALTAYAAGSNSYGVNATSVQSNAVVGITNNANAAAIYARNTEVNGLGLYVEGNATVAGTSTATGDVIANGAGNQQAYMGGDSNGDVEFGSKNAAVTLAAFYNPASQQLLDTLMRDASVRALTIRGGADIAEPFAIGGGEELPCGSVVVIGEDHVGELRRSERPYDTRVAGIVSGANGVNTGLSLSQPGVNDKGGQRVALTGRVYCLADASNGAIKPGDLLTTSATPGHAMKVTDHQRAQGAVLGKAMSALKEGTGYVLVLVTLQ